MITFHFIIIYLKMNRLIIKESLLYASKILKIIRVSIIYNCKKKKLIIFSLLKLYISKNHQTNGILCI